MKELTLEEIAGFSNGVVNHDKYSCAIRSISTDTRKLEKGSLFVALEGERFDGHDYVIDALASGASAAMVSKKAHFDDDQDLPLIRVEDTLIGLQKLARSYRGSLKVRGIGVTGSNGKTSTKDIIKSVLSQSYSVSATEGNYNNHIGLPLTLLETKETDAFGVWEMGMSNPGEIGLLAGIAQPDIGIITNIGVAHIENMGSQDSIAQEKGDLVERVSSNGYVVLNAEDEYSMSIAQRTSAETIMVGFDYGDVRADIISDDGFSTRFKLTGEGCNEEISLPFPGRHMILNSLMAIAVGLREGMSVDVIKRGLLKTELSSGRLQIKDINKVTYIDDTYNANPDSVIAALECLKNVKSKGRKFAVLGEMAELGEDVERYHMGVGKEAADIGIEYIISVGESAKPLNRGAVAGGAKKAIHIDSHQNCAQFLESELQAGDVVLIKGSRSSAMETILTIIENS